MVIVEMLAAILVAAIVYGLAKVRKLNSLLQIFLSLLSFMIAMILL